MHLLGLRVVRVGPFDDVVFPFTDEDDNPRLTTVVHGGGGIGKTSLLQAIATTRPGHAVVQPRRGDQEGQSFAVADWQLGDDDPERPHALRVVSPNAKLDGDDEAHSTRRREQAVFDRVAKDGGFVFVGISGMRWFSRQPIAIHAPLRSVARYDVRAASTFDDAARADLARETKQALAYAAITAALPDAGAHDGHHPDLLGSAMEMSVGVLCDVAGYAYRGLDPVSLEPVFEDQHRRVVTFDGLPTRVRHLVAMAALPTRALWAAYRERDPRTAQGVVAIDEVDLHQDPAVQGALVGALREALPEVQWILTTTSPIVAGSCDAREVLALRQIPDADRVELFTGSAARTH